MKRIILAAAAVVLLAGCGGSDGSEPREAESAELPTAETPWPTIGVAEACAAFKADADDAAAMRAVATVLDNEALAAAFKELADASEQQESASGMDLLDARAKAREAAADIDATC